MRTERLMFFSPLARENKQKLFENLVSIRNHQKPTLVMR